MNRESMNRDTRHVKSVQDRLDAFKSMTSSEIATELNFERLRVTERWESCQKSFKMLFAALNGSTSSPIDRFDIKTSHEQHDNTLFEDFVRIWRDHHDDTYKARPLVRKDGFILDHTVGETESFGAIYDYRFDTTHSRTAKIKIQDMAEGGVMLERRDGYLVNSMSQYEQAVLLSAITDEIMPSLDKTVDTLVLVWDSIQNEEWNPTYAKAYRDFTSRWQTDL